MRLPLAVRSVRAGLPAADVVAVFSDGKTFPLPASLARVARSHAERAGFKGEAAQTHDIPLPGRTARTLFAIGAGKALTLDTVRRGVAAAIQYAKAEGLRTVAIVAPAHLTTHPSSLDLGRAFAEGALLANYRFTTYTKESAAREKRLALQRVELHVPSKDREHTNRGMVRGVIDAEATMRARDLVNEPASHLTPQSLVAEAQKIAKASRGTVTLTVWDRAACEKRGMGAFLAVAKGSTAEPAFVHLVFAPTKQTRSVVRPRVVLVGKGITFDAGGLSLKPSHSMETMKLDMAGAASVLGVFSALPRLRFPVEVHGIIAACENMPSGTAVKPGDIVRTVSGKTIEILDTDAEGRLTLADALGIAAKLRPTAIIDLATLTGACVVALGEEVTGFFSNNDVVAERIRAAAERSGEPMWQLPLVRDYQSKIRGSIADLKNVESTRRAPGDAIFAALFLKEFVGNTPWVHLDIAGPSYAERQTNPVNPVGGTGVGVRTILRYLEDVGTRQ